MQVFYGHFYIEHNRGHHVNVSTPTDPSSAKKGQTFYAFLIQSIFGGIKSAWELEKQRLIIKKQAVFSWHNEALRLWFFSLLLFTSIVYISSNSLGFFHYDLLIYLLAQSLLAIIVLEGANYIEHYGIQRKLLADGKYEKVNPTHSWNTNHIMSNFLLFQLQRHSDHHKTASKPYQLLSQYEDSPQLPNGYPAMFLLALIPTLWFKVMHPKLKNWEESIQKYASN
jgi:alkane 1-monooxygenase